MARVTGRPVELLAYEEIARQLHVTGQSDRGLQEVPLEAIVGSVGRYADFTRTFLPRRDENVQRWARVKSAAASVNELPPIEVYQVGQIYFVLDGNHRVSIARQQGLDTIYAYVTEVRTRVPLGSNVQPDELIIKAEYANFLEFTHLDQLRPGADLVVSVPGQYPHLENLIEVYRYFVEMAEECELSDAEAVGRWYDEAYLPLVQAIREQGILRYFPGRTETDFYVWIARHQAALQHELGWSIRPQVAVSQLAGRVQPAPARLVTRLRQRVLNVVVPKRRKGGRPVWSQEKMLDRYSDRLFADILVAAPDTAEQWPALAQALVVAALEKAQLQGLCLSAAGAPAAGLQTLRQLFEEGCQAAGATGRLAVAGGDAAKVIGERAAVTDLVVVDQRFPGLQAILRRCARPVLVAPDEPSPLRRALLAYDGRPRSREALFAAAYLAEQHGLALVVLTVLEPGRTGPETQQHARDYLAMHEVEATFVVEEGPAAAKIVEAALAQGSDLLILGGYGRGRRALGDVVEAVLAAAGRPVLLCP